MNSKFNERSSGRRDESGVEEMEGIIVIINKVLLHLDRRPNQLKSYIRVT